MALWLGKDSGIELIRELRRKDRNVKLALCSGYMSVATAVNAMRAGADTVLLEPVGFTEILHRLEDSALDDKERDAIERRSRVPSGSTSCACLPTAIAT